MEALMMSALIVLLIAVKAGRKKHRTSG